MQGLELWDFQQSEEPEDAGTGQESVPIEDQYLEWKKLPGSRQVLRQAYRFTSHYARAFRARGQQVSVKLIWELMRYHIKTVRRRAKAKGVKIQKWQGYTLNNNFTAYLARDIMAHRQDWLGIFEIRSTEREKELAKVNAIRNERDWA